MYSRIAGRVAALIGLATLTLGTARAVDVGDLVKETQRMTTTDNEVQMVWWMTQQFWEESMKSNPSLSVEMRNSLLAPLGEYTIIAVMHAKAGAAGLTDAASKADMLKNLHVQFAGKELQPVAPEQLSPPAQMMLAQTKPAIAQAIGQVGENMEFIVFPRAVDGKTLDAAQPGDFNITFYDQHYTWRLPLGSVLPPKIDKKTGDQFPGNYEYNPYTGKKLDDK